jgi:hypothetical protein
MALRGNVGSRRERRGVPRYQWLQSLSHRKITTNAEKYLMRVRDIQKHRAAA